MRRFCILAASLLFSHASFADEPEFYLNRVCIPDAQYMLISSFTGYPNDPDSPFVAEKYEDVRIASSTYPNSITCEFHENSKVSVNFASLTNTKSKDSILTGYSFEVTINQKKIPSQPVIFQPAEGDIIVINDNTLTACLKSFQKKCLIYNERNQTFE